MMEQAWLLFMVLLVGAGGQLLDGTLGMGFGVFSASMLLAAGVPPITVVATVNAAKLLTGIFSGIAHWKAGNVRRDWLLPLIIPGVVGGALSAHLVGSLPPQKFRFWMAVVLLGMGILILCRTLFPMIFYSVPASGAQPTRRLFHRLYLGLVGFAAGVFNAISGAYGPFATSGVILIGKVKPAHAVGTVNMAEIFVAGSVISSLLSVRGLQTISWDIAIALDVGGALTAPIAAYACGRLPSRVLQVGVGLALISLNLKAVISQIV